MTAEIRDQPTIRQLMKWNALLFASSQAEYLANRLQSFGPFQTLEGAFEIDSLVSAFVITYGRMFTQSKGVAQLKPNIFDGTEFGVTHARTMELRHNRYAHHGSHSGVRYEQTFERDERGFNVGSRVTIKVEVQDFEHYQRIVDFLQRHIKMKSDALLDATSRALGNLIVRTNEGGSKIKMAGVHIQYTMRAERDLETKLSTMRPPEADIQSGGWPRPNARKASDD